MKKTAISLFISMVFICAVPLHVFADTDLKAEWFEKLEALTVEPISASDADTSEKDGMTPKQLYEMAAPKVVDIVTYDRDGEEFAGGTGFFINDSGVIVTNFHVMEDGYSAKVITESSEEYEVKKVIGYDPDIDLAILQIDLKDNEYLEIAEKAVETGDVIYTIGSSLGLVGTFSDGIVSMESRVIDGVDYIQITAPISSGNSGGPLLNDEGEVIGVNTWTLTEGQNVNFSININELTKIDVSNSVTVAQFYEDTKDLRTGYSEYDDYEDEADIEAWYALADTQEQEGNDDLDTTQILYSSESVAGCVEDVDDLDFYTVTIRQETEFSAVLVPMYEDDDEYLCMALLDEEGNIIGAGEEESSEDGVYQFMDVNVTEPGEYYVAILVLDEYPYVEPAYYILAAQW